MTYLIIFASKWNSNESEESDEESISDSDSEDDQSVASKSIKENKKAKAEVIPPTKVSIPITKKAKRSSAKTPSMVDDIKREVSTADIKGKRDSAPKAKARTTSEGKLVVSLGVSPKFSLKTKKKSLDDIDESVVKHGDFDDDFLVDSDDESIRIRGMIATKMKRGQVSKNLKRKHDPDSNESNSFEKKSRGSGVAQTTRMALELLDSEDDRCGKSESDSGIECY